MIGYPLDSRVTYDKDGIPVYDRAVTSAPLRKLTKSLFSDGVLPNPSTNLQIVADGERVIIKAGFALCDGCQKLQEEDATINLPAADNTNSRIDTVVLRLNNNEEVRECEFHIISGVAAASPIRPVLTRTESIWEIGLADITRRANSTEITNANITDTRYETERCGIISSISRFDTTTLYQQIQSDLEQFRSVSQEEFKKWFDTIKNTLSGDTAGNLQNQINALIGKIGELPGLNTDNKTSLVAALNEIKANIPTKTSQLTNDSNYKSTDTWKPNTASSEGYVKSGNGHANKFWGTDENGRPGWREIDVLDTAEAIKANTRSGKVAGAKGTKELFEGVSERLAWKEKGTVTGTAAVIPLPDSYNELKIVCYKDNYSILNITLPKNEITAVVKTYYNSFYNDMKNQYYMVVEYSLNGIRLTKAFWGTNIASSVVTKLYYR